MNELDTVWSCLPVSRCEGRTHLLLWVIVQTWSFPSEMADCWDWIGWPRMGAHHPRFKRALSSLQNYECRHVVQNSDGGLNRPRKMQTSHVVLNYVFLVSCRLHCTLRRIVHFLVLFICFWRGSLFFLWSSKVSSVFSHLFAERNRLDTRLSTRHTSHAYDKYLEDSLRCRTPLKHIRRSGCLRVGLFLCDLSVKIGSLKLLFLDDTDTSHLHAKDTVGLLCLRKS